MPNANEDDTIMVCEMTKDQQFVVSSGYEPTVKIWKMPEQVNNCVHSFRS